MITWTHSSNVFILYIMYAEKILHDVQMLKALGDLSFFKHLCVF
jgi:hypothetical protein